MTDTDVAPFVHGHRDFEQSNDRSAQAVTMKRPPGHRGPFDFAQVRANGNRSQPLWRSTKDEVNGMLNYSTTAKARTGKVPMPLTRGGIAKNFAPDSGTNSKLQRCSTMGMSFFSKVE